MIKISQIKMPIRSDMAALENKICEILRVDKSRITDWQIEKRSIAVSYTHLDVYKRQPEIRASSDEYDNTVYFR